MEATTLISLDSTRCDVSGGKKSHLQLRCNEPISLRNTLNYEVCVSSLHIPYTVYNITAALGNNTLRYDLTGAGGGSFVVVTIDDGVYSIQEFQANLQKQLRTGAVAAYEIGSSSPYNDKYPFWFHQDNATGKCWVDVWDVTNGTAYTKANYMLDLSNGATSTLYSTLGFTGPSTSVGSTDCKTMEVKGGCDPEYQAANVMNLHNDVPTFRIDCNLVRSFGGLGTHASTCAPYARALRKLITLNWYNTLPREYLILDEKNNDISAPLDKEFATRGIISMVDVKIVDEHGTPLLFSGNEVVQIDLLVRPINTYTKTSRYDTNKAGHTSGENHQIQSVFAETGAYNKRLRMCQPDPY